MTRVRFRAIEFTGVIELARRQAEQMEQVRSRSGGGVSEGRGGDFERDPLAALALFSEMLRRTHLSAPSDLAAIVRDQVTVAGGADATIYLVDYEQEHLIPVPVEPGDRAGTEAAALAGESRVLAVEGTIAGRCYSASEVISIETDQADRQRLWLPLLDGTERLGVLSLTVPAGPVAVPDQVGRVWEPFAHLIAELVVSKGAYSDVFERVRRRARMEIGAELIWSLLPPATFATTGFVVSGMLEPCYRAGGDAFDYAVNERTAHLAILDAMGHGAAACEAAAFTLSAYRSARRAGLDLTDTYRSVDDAMSAFYDGDRYATAVFAELDLATGRLSWLNAGHPEPLVIRGGRQVKTLRRVPLTPLGVPFTAGPIEAGIEQLEPGDGVLLYTDGLPEARQPDGSFFGLGRLVDFVERAGQAGYPAPETLRRLRDSVLRHQHGELQDDASALLMEWRRGTEQAMVPGNVLPAATDDEPAVRPTRS